LHGSNTKTGGAFEILLLEENSSNDWWAMMRPGKRAKVGTQIKLTEKIFTTVTDTDSEGHRRLRFTGTENILNDLDSIGQLPLPPYIERDEKNLPASDRERYQTIYAKPQGSVAAPTAGLHFTEDLLSEIRARGVEICFVTLHVGLGTFAPVKTDTLAEHIMHEERYEITEATAKAVNTAKKDRRRVIAVGTTSVRVLESAAEKNGGNIQAESNRTRIFIFPPRSFKIVDGLLTNFHLPCSTLLMLVSAFASPGEMLGRGKVLSAYSEAISERYRFFSYGDAMLLL
jgi:S-adenosylmethionine:tRNA ribosyltransferase-isomerase